MMHFQALASESDLVEQIPDEIYPLGSVMAAGGVVAIFFRASGHEYCIGAEFEGSQEMGSVDSPCAEHIYRLDVIREVCLHYLTRFFVPVDAVAATESKNGWPRKIAV